MSMEAPVTGSTSATVIASTVAGDGLVANGTAVDVNPGNGIDLVSDAVQVQPSEIAGLGLETDGATPPKLRVKVEVRTRQASWDKVPDAAGTTATSERPIFYNNLGVTLSLVAAVLAVASNHVGNDTNNFVLVIRKRDAAGAATTIVTYTNNVASGGITAWVPKDLGALSSATLAAGETLTVEITKNGTGATMSGLLLAVGFTLPG